MNRRGFLSSSLALAGSTVLPVKAAPVLEIVEVSLGWETPYVASGSVWAQKSAEEITADVRACIEQVWKQEASCVVRAPDESDLQFRRRILRDLM